MFKSLKVGWAANDIGERIERVTGYVVNILIYYRIDIKTHDTIFIFSQIYSHFTHRDYGPYLEKNGQAFIDKMDERLKFDLKPWLIKALNVPKDVTTIKSVDVFFEEELDVFKREWHEGYLELRKETGTPHSVDYTGSRIFSYLEKLGHSIDSELAEKIKTSLQ